jgi:hypothetical protein
MRASLARRPALAEMADANGLPRGAPSYPQATALEMFMFNYPKARAAAPLRARPQSPAVP